MRLNSLGDLFDDIDASMLGTNVEPSIAPIEAGTIATTTGITSAVSSTTDYSWLNSLLAPIVSVANNAITQRAITERQRQQIAAGIVPGTNLQTNAAGQSLLFGIPIIYIIGGGAAWLLLKK